MKELIEKINTEFETLKTDAALQAENDNKVASTRVAKSTLELEKLLKGFFGYS